MKFKVEVDCTPGEAREFFGLPDLKPMQDRMMVEMELRLRHAMQRLSPETITQSWFSMWGMDQAKAAWDNLITKKKN